MGARDNIGPLAVRLPVTIADAAQPGSGLIALALLRSHRTSS